MINENEIIGFFNIQISGGANTVAGVADKYFLIVKEIIDSLKKPLDGYLFAGLRLVIVPRKQVGFWMRTQK